MCTSRPVHTGPRPCTCQHQGHVLSIACPHPCSPTVALRQLVAQQTVHDLMHTDRAQLGQTPAPHVQSAAAHMFRGSTHGTHKKQEYSTARKRVPQLTNHHACTAQSTVRYTRMHNPLPHLHALSALCRSLKPDHSARHPQRAVSHWETLSGCRYVLRAAVSALELAAVSSVRKRKSVAHQPYAPAKACCRPEEQRGARACGGK